MKCIKNEQVYSAVLGLMNVYDDNLALCEHGEIVRLSTKKRSHLCQGSKWAESLSEWAIWTVPFRRHLLCGPTTE